MDLRHRRPWLLLRSRLRIDFVIVVVDFFSTLRLNTYVGLAQLLAFALSGIVGATVVV